MALAIHTPDHYGLAVRYSIPERPGQVLEVDVAFPHRNTQLHGKTVKQPSLGGATAYAICLCGATSYVMVRLINSTEALPFIRYFLDENTKYKHQCEILAADTGIHRFSTVQLDHPTVIQYLQSHHIEPRLAEPRRHNNGTPQLDHCIRSMGELMSLAETYTVSSVILLFRF